MKKLFSVLLALLMMAGVIAVAPITASAAVGIAAGVPTFTVNTASPTLIGFGGKQWAVIGYNGSGVASESGKLTLLLANGESYGNPNYFKVNSPYSNEYSGSDLKTAMEGAYGTLPAKEQALVAARDLAGGSGLYSSPNTTGYDPDKVAGPAVTGAKFWPLSAGEATAVNATVRQYGSWWWLRSPGNYQDRAAGVGDDGYVYLPGYTTFREAGGVRPALRLNLSSVLFASDASGASAKSSAAPGGGLVPAQPAGAALKFTMQDASLALGGVTTNSRSGDTVSFSYSGATAGKTLSAVVLGSGGAVKYYGKLLASTAASGTASVTLPGDFLATDTVQIFIEEANGDNQTDFASAYKQLTVPTPHTHDYGMAWQKDAAGHWKECACGEKDGEAAHTPGSWTVDKAATATETGSQHRTCSVCGYVETQTIPATGVKTIFSTRYEANFLNWILFFLGFGFIWMWF